MRIVSTTVPKFVPAGAEIVVRTRRPALFVTDSAGNTYVRESRLKWVCRCSRHAPALEVTTTYGPGQPEIEPDALGHRTRFSDSSLYDFVCVACGATDGCGDRGLERRCPGPK